MKPLDFFSAHSVFTREEYGPLRLASGEVRRAPLGEIGETDEVERGPRPLLYLGLRRRRSPYATLSKTV